MRTSGRATRACEKSAGVVATREAAARPWSAAASHAAAVRRISRSMRDHKSAPFAAWRHPLDPDVGDPRPARPPPGPRDQLLDGGRLALDLGLDRAVGPVAHPAGDA